MSMMVNQVQKVMIEAYKSELSKLVEKLGNDTYFERMRQTHSKRAVALYKEWLHKRVKELKNKIMELEDGTK